MSLNSLYANLLVELQERITTEVPAIRWVDQDFGQMEHYGERPAVSLPCVLIDFTGTKYDQLGELAEMGDCNIQCRLCFPQFSPSNNLAPDGVKEKALNYYEIENAIYIALKGWCPASDICQPLNRLSDTTERRSDPFRVRVLIFTTSFQDDSAVKVFTQRPRPALNIEHD
jgi:hypothetical protein